VGSVGAKKEGFVYLLSNPSMPGMVKIGRTIRDPAKRAAELTSSSGVPTPFHLEGYVLSPDAVKTEAAVHRAVKGRRVNSRREFFHIEPARALSIMRRVAADERLVLTKKNRRQCSWIALGHLLCILFYFNVALSINGFDHSEFWKVAAVNAAPAILLPSRGWKKLMMSFRRRPLQTHLISIIVTVCGVSAFGVFMASLLAGTIRSIGL
jgi:hypothetical protein